MARSLTIQQEESAATSPLFTGFLVLSVLVLLFGALAGASSEGASVAPVQSSFSANP